MPYLGVKEGSDQHPNGLTKKGVSEVDHQGVIYLEEHTKKQSDKYQTRRSDK